MDINTFNPYFTALSLLQAVIKTHPQEFSWREPPYEYEYTKMPVDLLTGDPSIRIGLESGELSPLLMREKWALELGSYIALKKEYHIYQ